MPKTNICVVVTIDVVVRAVLAVKEVMVTIDVPMAAALVTISMADGDNNIFLARTTKKSAVH
jgi:hypothetical protein